MLGAGGRTLVAHFRVDEGQGDRLLDHSGHGHHGLIVGARWEQAGGRWALRCDGSGEYVDFGDNRALKTSGDFTLLAWVTLDAPAYTVPSLVASLAGPFNW